MIELQNLKQVMNLKHKLTIKKGKKVKGKKFRHEAFSSQCNLKEKKKRKKIERKGVLADPPSIWKIRFPGLPFNLFLKQFARNKMIRPFGHFQILKKIVYF